MHSNHCYSPRFRSRTINSAPYRRESQVADTFLALYYRQLYQRQSSTACHRIRRTFLSYACRHERMKGAFEVAFKVEGTTDLFMNEQRVDEVGWPYDIFSDHRSHRLALTITSGTRALRHPRLPQMRVPKSEGSGGIKSSSKKASRPPRNASHFRGKPNSDSTQNRFRKTFRCVISHAGTHAYCRSHAFLRNADTMARHSEHVSPGAYVLVEQQGPLVHRTGTISPRNDDNTTQHADRRFHVQHFPHSRTRIHRFPTLLTSPWLLTLRGALGPSVGSKDEDDDVEVILSGGAATIMVVRGAPPPTFLLPKCGPVPVVIGTTKASATSMCSPSREQNRGGRTTYSGRCCR